MNTEWMADEARAALENYSEVQRLRKETASLREQIRLASERADAAESKAAHLQKRLEVAHESISFANDKMAEQVRQARWDVANDALCECDTLADFLARMERICADNAPKD